MKTTLAIFLCCCLLLPGCDKPGPIELVDRSVGSPTVEVDTTTNEQPGLNPNAQEIDSSGFFVSTGGKVFGQIIVAGARFDATDNHHVATLAQVIFFDKSQPIIVLGDTVAYKTVTLGDVRVNDLLTMKYTKKYTSSAIPSLDTLLGFQYILYNKDGLGGRGFQYSGNAVFRWEGRNLVSGFSFQDSLVTPPMIRVQSPEVGEVVDVTKNLRVELEGNVDEITIVIRRMPARSPEVIIDEKPILKLKVNKVGSGIVIPSALLRLLPASQNTFLFSFHVEKSRLTRFSGYPDDVLMTGSYVHHLVLRTKRQ